MDADDVMLPGGSASHVGGHHLSLMTLAAAGRVVMARTFDGDEILPLLRRGAAHQDLDAAVGALCARARSPCPARGLRLGRSVLLGRRQGVRRARGGVHRAGRRRDRRGLRDDRDRHSDRHAAGVAEDRLGRPARARVPGVAARSRGSRGRDRRAGRLWIEFAGNMVGYWNNPQATAETIVDGWLDTGDVMHADEDGYLWFHGRQKQIIIHDGSNICPQEVEAALLEHDAVSSAGVVGVQSPLHGENVRAYVTLDSLAAPPTMQDLVRFARDRVGYKAPGGGCRAGPDAAQRHRQARPRDAQAMGRRGDAAAERAPIAAPKRRSPECPAGSSGAGTGRRPSCKVEPSRGSQMPTAGG